MGRGARGAVGRRCWSKSRIERAVIEGVEEPVYHYGKLVGHAAAVFGQPVARRLLIAGKAATTAKAAAAAATKTHDERGSGEDRRTNCGSGSMLGRSAVANDASGSET